MVGRGKDHLGAVCVVATHLADRAWAVLSRGMPYVVCDTDATPVTPAQAKAIIAERYTVPPRSAPPAGHARRRRRERPLTKSTVDIGTTVALEAQSRGGLPHDHPHHRPAHRSSRQPPDPAAPSRHRPNAGVVDRPNASCRAQQPGAGLPRPSAGQTSTNQKNLPEHQFDTPTPWQTDPGAIGCGCQQSGLGCDHCR